MSDRTVPSWADVQPWEDDLRFVAHPSRPDVALTLRTEEQFRPRVVRYWARLFLGERFVAACRVLGPGNFDLPDGNVLCDVEVHPEFRGRRLPALLLGMVQDEIGVVHRSGMFSVSGFAASKYLDLPIVPGREVRLSDTVEYSFVDWSTGAFE